MLRCLISLVTALSVSTGPVAASPAEPPLHKVASLKITILSTMLADQGMGEWGFYLGIDHSSVTDVVLSHHHGDHTGGLLALRRELSKKAPGAMSRIHVAPGIFLSRRASGSPSCDRYGARDDA